MDQIIRSFFLNLAIILCYIILSYYGAARFLWCYMVMPVSAIFHFSLMVPFSCYQLVHKKEKQLDVAGMEARPSCTDGAAERRPTLRRKTLRGRLNVEKMKAEDPT